MYLRQSNKWKEWLLQEAVEDIGLPPAISHFLRQQNEEFGPVENKHLTWIGTLLKDARQDLWLHRENLMEIRNHLQRAVRVALDKKGADASRPEDYAVFGELFAEALAPLIEFKNQREKESPNIIDIKKFKKRFLKNLIRLEKDQGIDLSQLRKGFDSYVDNRMEIVVRDYFMDLIKPIMRLLAEDPQSYNDLREEDGLRMAGRAAQEILDNPPKAEEQVIHEFDNGYFWYDIRSHACNFEAKKMGHCGSGDYGQLYSLRSGEKRNIKPMVTLEMDSNNIVYQIKGKGNTAPRQEFWPYIDWFIENMNVQRILEKGAHSSDYEGFALLRQHLEEEHSNVQFDNQWVEGATALLQEVENYIESDNQTFLEIDYPSDDDIPANITLRHQAFWPVKDVIVDEDTHRLRWEIKQDAQNYAELALNPTPRVNDATVFARGIQDSRSAMIRIQLIWEDYFEPDDIDDEEAIKEELERLKNHLEELQEISSYLVSDEAAPEEAEFDYNEFWERVEERLKALGVYRDIAAEEDAEEERSKSGQLELPLQEQRTIQRWAKIIK